jgi:hypothetical protein
MAQTHQMGDPTVIADNPLTELLAAPLTQDSTIEGLVEKLLSTIAARKTQDTSEVQEFVLDIDSLLDRQSRRLLRPFLACLANKFAAESATDVNLYCGAFSFRRTGPEGNIWIFGQFENRPGNVRIAIRRSASSPFIGVTEILPTLPQAI